MRMVRFCFVINDNLMTVIYKLHIFFVIGAGERFFNLVVNLVTRNG